MTPEIKQLNDEIEEADRHLRSLKNRLEYAVKTCHHVWGTPAYDPIITPGGYDPGDPPGTMGVDRRGPCSWPEQREPRWKRVCTKCGQEEYTRTTAQTVTHVPKFSY